MIQRFEGKYEFLSNFHPVQIKMKGVMYPSVEHAYQAAKFTEDCRREQIRNCRTPGQAKRLARDWKEFVRPDWREINMQLYEALQRAKYAYPGLRDMLLATGDEELQEGNWWGDDWFGVVIAHGSKPCEPYGENHAGKMLMRIRQELREAAGAQTQS